MVVMYYLKRWTKKNGKKSMYSAFVGRLIDKSNPEKGRLTYKDIKKITEDTMIVFEELLKET